MTTINTDDRMNAQIQNWDNFCRHHAGDWYGIWNRYSSEGEVIESFKCVRSFHASVDGSEVNHQNYYVYADGETETQTFGPYKKPTTRALFLDNSFSWGSTTVDLGSPFGFETGFRYEDRRASAAVVYDNSGKLQHIVIIPEHVASFAEKPPNPQAFELNCSWLGTLIRMTPDWIVSPTVATSWTQLEDLGEDYLTIHYPDGVSVSCPRQLESGKEFFLVVDWLVNPTFLYRGIRHFDTFGFTSFTLQSFTSAL